VQSLPEQGRNCRPTTRRPISGVRPYPCPAPSPPPPIRGARVVSGLPPSVPGCAWRALTRLCWQERCGEVGYWKDPDSSLSLTLPASAVTQAVSWNRPGPAPRPAEVAHLAPYPAPRPATQEGCIAEHRSVSTAPSAARRLPPRPPAPDPQPPRTTRGEFPLREKPQVSRSGPC
jgi:hypothetical protein